MRALAVLLALLVPVGQVLAVAHLHCALEHPLGRMTTHATGEGSHPAADPHAADHGHDGHGSHGGADAGDQTGDRPAAEHGDDDSRASTPFDDHHHHGGASSSHAGCCIGGAGSAMPCGFDFHSVDVRGEHFAVPMPSRGYVGPFHEPPPRPQWRAHAPA